MWNVIWLGLVIVLMNFVGCSSKPVYEKMSTVYIVHLDMKAGAQKAARKAYDSPGSVRDENMDLMDGILNKELKMQFDDIPRE